MVCTAKSIISANSCCAFPYSSQKRRINPKWAQTQRAKLFIVNANNPSTTDDDDCNQEECAPEKEVGKVSMQWLAGERTKVVGTFPPKKRGWTGYVEKDTAGQTNIYSVEPTIYVAESVISSGSAGTSADGAENTAAVTAGLALISIAAASTVLLQVGKNQIQVQTVPYSGPPLSYYINKFKPTQMVEASVAPELQAAPSIEASVPPEASRTSTLEVSEVQVELKEGESEGF